jgi:hypothetical protein
MALDVGSDGLYGSEPKPGPENAKGESPCKGLGETLAPDFLMTDYFVGAEPQRRRMGSWK